MEATRHILIVDSIGEKNQLLIELLEEAAGAGCRFSLASSGRESSLADFFQEKKWPKKLLSIASDPFMQKRMFWFAYPLMLLIWYFRMFVYKYRNRVDTLLLIGPAEKYLLYSPAKLLRLKTIWFDIPGADYPKQGRGRGRFAKRAGRAKLLAVGNASQRNLMQLGAAPETITLIEPAIKLHQYKFQESIFQKIAEAETLTKKFFNCGIICGLHSSEQIQRLEFLFNAAKTARMVIPNLQLIVVGNGEQKKKVTWLAKKMEIESIVWLVGEQNHLRKWLDSFDLYLAFPHRATLNDFQNIIRAMEAGLPIIAAYGLNFEDIIEEEMTGLLSSPNDSEALAGQMIRLKQDKRLAARLGETAKAKAEQRFGLEKAAETFIKLLQQ